MLSRTTIGDLEVRCGGAAPTIPLGVRVDAEDEGRFVSALRACDESAFVTLIERYHAMMVRLAVLFVKDTEIAEEVVQETWLGVLRSLGRFRSMPSAWQGGWVSFPGDWDAGPDECHISKETDRHIRACIDGLPEGRRKVLVLRDVHGWITGGRKPSTSRRDHAGGRSGTADT